MVFCQFTMLMVRMWLEKSSAKLKIPEVVDYYLPSEVEHPNLHTNKVYMGAKVESMYVSEIKNHRLHNNECLGDLKFDCS